jgi:uncharacterized protein YjbI with pentapeptide repeats
MMVSVATRRVRPRAGVPEAPRLGHLPDEGVRLDPDEVGELSDARIVAIEGDDLDDLELTRCVVEGVRLTARSARRVRLTDVVLRDCELSGADLQEAQLVRVRVERCRAEGLDAGLLRATDVVVVDTKLTDAGLRMTRWERAAFEGCDLRGAELLEATLDHVEVTACDFTGVDVTRARMTGVRFRSSRLDGMKGPTALAGSAIDSPQTVPVALALFAQLGIRIVDDEEPDAGR